MEAVWRATGGELRAGLAIWQPFEQLDWPTQETMLRAAATALALALNFNAMMEEVIAEARRDRAATRQLMSVLTFGCRSPIQFDEQRADVLLGDVLSLGGDIIGSRDRADAG